MGDNNKYSNDLKEPNGLSWSGSLIIPEYRGKPLFAPGDGDIHINNTDFEAHKYILKRFNTLKDMIDTGTPLNLQRDEHGESDFGNALIILYASVLEGPFAFDTSTLISGLRIATAYDYPTLRSHSIQCLEVAGLDAIERVKIAREFELKSWEEPACKELCERDKSITIEEANVLGMELFVQVARTREQAREQRNGETEPSSKGAKPKDRPGHELVHTGTKSVSSDDMEQKLGPEMVAHRFIERIHDADHNLYQVSIASHPTTTRKHSTTTAEFTTAIPPTVKELRDAIPHASAFYCRQHHGWVVLSVATATISQPGAQRCSGHSENMMLNELPQPSLCSHRNRSEVDTTPDHGLVNSRLISLALPEGKMHYFHRCTPADGGSRIPPTVKCQSTGPYTQPPTSARSLESADTRSNVGSTRSGVRDELLPLERFDSYAYCQRKSGHFDTDFRYFTPPQREKGNHAAVRKFQFRFMTS